MRNLLSRLGLLRISLALFIGCYGHQGIAQYTFQNDGTVSDAVYGLEGLMAGTGPGGLGCTLPVVYKNANDQLKSKHGAPIDGLQMRNSLLDQLQLTPYKDTPTTFFDGFVTRLFDTPSTNNVFGALTDQELLGVVQPATDPNALLMWKVDSSILKYDCTSLLKIAAKATANYSYLNLASLQSSFDGSESTSSSKSVVILTGHAQSLFDVYYGNNGTPTQRLFAAIKAIEWYKSPLVGTMASADQRLRHLSEAQIISYASMQNITSNQNIAASLSASLSSIPVVSVSASGSTSLQLSNAFQQMSNSFKTFYFNANATALPALSDLVKKAQGAIILNGAEVNNGTGSAAVFPKQVVQLQGTINGWPISSCNDSLWNGGVSDTNNFSFSGSHLQQASANTIDGFPVCTVSFAATVSSAATSGSYDPKFTLTYKGDTNISFIVPMPSTLVNVVTVPTFTASNVQPVPVPTPTSGAGGPTAQILWVLNGSTITNGETIQSYSIDPTNKCSLADGTVLQLSSEFTSAFNSSPTYPLVFGASATTSQSVVSPGIYQTIWLGFYGNTSTYDMFAPLSSYQSCTLGGNLHMTINGGAVDSPFTSAISFPPKRAAVSVKSIDCGQPAASPNTLSLAASTNGIACTLYGSNLDLASQVVISGGGINLTEALSLGKDSSQAKFNLPQADIPKLTKNTTYSITINLSAGPPMPSAVNLLVGQ